MARPVPAVSAVIAARFVPIATVPGPETVTVSGTVVDGFRPTSAASAAFFGVT